GYATGVVGLRLFPNPQFDEAAAKAWDANRYYTDPAYYNSRTLVRPYRVGMSCGFCHIGPNPTKPPADPENPKWENLSSNVGAQYFWVDRIFDWDADPSTFVYQLFPRLLQGKHWGKETLAGGGLNNKQFNDYVKDGPMAQFFEAPGTVWT